MHDDDNDPANDNAITFDIDELDARLLSHTLILLDGAREVGMSASVVFDILQLREPNAEPDCIRTALRDARRAGFIVLKNKRFYLARAVSQTQVMYLWELVRGLSLRGSK